MTLLALVHSSLIQALPIADLSAPTPSPIPAFTGDPNQVTPGVIGFAVTFFVVIATVLLVIDMTRRVRRVRYRAEVAEKLDAEQRAAEQRGTEQGGTAPTDDTTPTT